MTFIGSKTTGQDRTGQVCHVHLVTVVCVCVCAVVTEVYDTMSCLPIMSDRAATKGSKYFELGQQPHEFFNSKYLLMYVV